MNSKRIDKIVKVPFRVLLGVAFPASTGSTITTMNLNASNLGERVAAMCTAFEFFRISKLHIKQHTTHCSSLYNTGTPAMVGLVIAHHGIAFDPDASGDIGTVTTLAQMSQFGPFELGNVYDKLRFSLGPGDLYQATPLKWYNTTNTGTLGASQVSAGTLIQYLSNGLTVTQPASAILILEGVVEFKGVVSNAIALQHARETLSGEIVVKTTFYPADSSQVEESKDDYVTLSIPRKQLQPSM